MKILVTGANGQLGAALRKIEAPAEMFFTDVDTLNICDRDAVESFMRSNRVDTVVNCAAYTAVDKAEDCPDECMRINRDAVQNLGAVAASIGAKVIHISTDYVFDGLSARPYREDDAVNPTSVYGATKLAGEQALAAVCNDHIIIRTAWLYSETGNNFVKTMLRLGAERGVVGVVTDQRGTPTYAADLASAVVKILFSGKFVPGIYHYTDAGECSWYDFAVRIFALAGLKCKVNPLTTAEYPTRASRPAYSVLDKSKINTVYGIVPPQWEESLERFIRQYLKIKI
ncbi:MAG: dTDP-4-dehydrorhamnose reductase [Tannerella sp.]|jgi:dTDP-4-dehydrorhamnose reductase|nr:dTDP-4-dehydrorhamnose reductase [Tannerella sp.]